MSASAAPDDEVEDGPGAAKGASKGASGGASPPTRWNSLQSPMASPDRLPVSLEEFGETLRPIRGRLAEMMVEPWRFDVLDTLRRLERSHPDKPRIGTAAARRDEFITLGQDPFLDFPASNLHKVEREALAPERMRVLVKFLGLLGPQGALPLATTDEVHGWWLQRDDAFPRFLDLFNHRFLSLFFRAWADSRPIAHHDRPEDDRFEGYVGAMIGLGSPIYRDLDSVPDLAKLGFAGLLAPASRSASRLEGLLGGLFGARVEVEQFVGMHLPFEPADRTRLGARHATLGVDALIGSGVLSLQDRFRIRVYAASMREYERFLPTGDRAERFTDLVFFAVGEQLDWDVELAIPERAVEPTCLSRSGRLGWTTWMAPAREGPRGETLRTDARFHLADRMRHRRETRQAEQSRKTGARVF